MPLYTRNHTTRTTQLYYHHCRFCRCSPFGLLSFATLFCSPCRRTTCAPLAPATWTNNIAVCLWNCAPPAFRRAPHTVTTRHLPRFGSCWIPAPFRAHLYLLQHAPSYRLDGYLPTLHTLLVVSSYCRRSLRFNNILLLILGTLFPTLLRSLVGWTFPVSQFLI